MDRPLDVITYSSGTTLCHCEAKYAWRYERGIVPKHEDSEALFIGSAMHVGQEAMQSSGLDAALEAITTWANQPTIGNGQRAKIEEQVAKARAMVRASALRWPSIAGRKVLAEQVVSMPLVNPLTNHPSRSFTYMGKFDGLDNGQLHDWKGSSDPQRTVREKTIGYQTECYAMAAIHQGHNVTSAQFRIIARPSLQFCKSGEYTKKYAGNAAAYEDACYEWLLERPERMIEHEMWLDTGRIEKARYWLWSVGQRILSNRRSGIWLCNELACHSWSRTCEYAPLCEAAASGGDVQWLIDQQYEQRQIHAELGTEVAATGEPL